MPLAPKRNNSAFSHESPTSSFIRASQSSDCLAVRMPPAGIFERGDLIIEHLPLTAEDVRAGDDHVDFVSAGFHRAPNFPDAFRERRKTGRESRGDRRNMNAAALDGPPCGFDEGVINAYRSDLDIEALDAKLLEEFLLNRLARLGA